MFLPVKNYICLLGGIGAKLPEMKYALSRLSPKQEKKKKKARGRNFGKFNKHKIALSIPKETFQGLTLKGTKYRKIELRLKNTPSYNHKMYMRFLATRTRRKIKISYFFLPYKWMGRLQIFPTFALLKDNFYMDLYV